MLNKLPTYEECERVCDTPEETPLHRFIYNWEPAGIADGGWGTELFAVITSIEKGMK